MLEGLLWTVVGLIILIVAALAVPIDVVARIEAAPRPRGWLTIAWLFGLVRIRRTVGGRKTPRPKKKPERRQRMDSRGRRKPSAALIRRGVRLAGDLLRRIRVRRVELDVSFGTEDPATTGECAGFAAPIVALANTLPGTRVTLTPDFAGAAFAASGTGEFRLVPLRFLPPLVGFALSPEVRAWRSTRH